ncbi:MAG: protein kinase [Ktedonobacterales bacterium]|nr:protein kinase [Ktedonobacterales bacterium]
MAYSEGDALPVGTIVSNRYQIVRIVGQGGLGTVYQVADVVYGKNNVYALKELVDQSPGARKQFAQEAQWLRALNHPHIPKVRDYFEWEQRHYLVMDFVDGENLDEKLRRLGGRGLPEPQVLAWILPICDALQYLHMRHPPILHRDVKPANIIVTSAGHPVLVDLGIAKEHRPGANQTATFVRKAGTEGYAPPEQYTNAGQAGPWSDVYSLGATLYELLTGCIPPTAVERVALDVRLVALRELNPAISPHVADAVVRAVTIRPSDRYQLVADFAAALMGPDTSTMAAQTAARMPSPPFSPPVAPAMSPPMSSPPTPRVGGGGTPGRSSGPSGTSGPSGGRLRIPPATPSGPTRATPPRQYPSTPSLPGSSSPSGRPSGSDAGRAIPAGFPAEWEDGLAAPSPGQEPHEERPWYSLPIVWIAGVAAALVIAGVISVTLLGIFTPLDRSTPQATISGYFQALTTQDDARAWQYAAASRTAVSSQNAFISGLKADDARLGRVTKFQIIQAQADNTGHVDATVAVTRANAPSTPANYTLSLTQYDGNTWLIDSISAN